MKVYLAGEQFSGVESLVRRRLFSFWYHRKNPAVIQQFADRDLFLDCGAFSAHYSAGVSIDIDEYARFIHDYGNLFTVRSNLDKTNKDCKATYDNQKYLESCGCKVQPVFHTREDPAWLVKYLDEGYDYIFIGGMVSESTPFLKAWLDELWDKYLTLPDGTARIKLHGFGLTDQTLMYRYPWHSVDSTSWLFTGAMGSCFILLDGRFQKVVFSAESPAAKNLNAPHYANLPAAARKRVDAYLESCGTTAELCSQHYSYRNIVNVHSFQNMEDMGERTFKKQELNLFD